MSPASCFSKSVSGTRTPPYPIPNAEDRQAQTPESMQIFMPQPRYSAIYAPASPFYTVHPHRRVSAPEFQGRVLFSPIAEAGSGDNTVCGSPNNIYTDKENLKIRELFLGMHADLIKITKSIHRQIELIKTLPATLNEIKFEKDPIIEDEAKNTAKFIKETAIEKYIKDYDFVKPEGIEKYNFLEPISINTQRKYFEYLEHRSQLVDEDIKQIAAILYTIRSEVEVYESEFIEAIGKKPSAPVQTPILEALSGLCLTIGAFITIMSPMFAFSIRVIIFIFGVLLFFFKISHALEMYFFDKREKEINVVKEGFSYIKCTMPLVFSKDKVYERLMWDLQKKGGNVSKLLRFSELIQNSSPRIKRSQSSASVTHFKKTAARPSVYCLPDGKTHSYSHVGYSHTTAILLPSPADLV